MSSILINSLLTYVSLRIAFWTHCLEIRRLTVALLRIFDTIFFRVRVKVSFVIISEKT
ncbi:MAG: hypothetical protein LBB88_06955 [Planctomycetaceae bacterium]|nr:hypothetical protein [Planctomycetaceae bacterium]